MGKEFINFFLECTFFISFNLFPLTVYAQTHTWTHLDPSGSYISRHYSHSAVYDEINDKMIVFGGTVGVQYPAPSNSVWVLSSAIGTTGTPNWTSLSPAGTAPFSRSSHTVVYDSTTNTMIVFGGNGSSGSLNDVWVLTNANGLGGVPRFDGT